MTHHFFCIYQNLNSWSWRWKKNHMARVRQWTNCLSSLQNGLQKGLKTAWSTRGHPSYLCHSQKICQKPQFCLLTIWDLHVIIVCNDIFIYMCIYIYTHFTKVILPLTFFSPTKKSVTFFWGNLTLSSCCVKKQQLSIVTLFVDSFFVRILLITTYWWRKRPVKNSWMSYGQLNHHFKKGYTVYLHIYIIPNGGKK